MVFQLEFFSYFLTDIVLVVVVELSYFVVGNIVVEDNTCCLVAVVVGIDNFVNNLVLLQFLFFFEAHYGVFKFRIQYFVEV